jgi:hypothetical protein
MIKSIRYFPWVFSAVAAVFATRPAAAYTINWNGAWTWYGNGGSTLDYTPRCMDINATATGIGVYAPTKTSWNGKVMYWFDGGGYCFDNQSCNVNAMPANTELALDFLAGTTPRAPFVFRKTFVSTDFNNYLTQSGSLDINGMYETKPFLKQGIFDQTVGNTNPFHNYVQVFVPYCTGDAHLGANRDTVNTPLRTASGINFMGLTNAVNAVKYSDLAVRAVGAPSVSVITGGSAGGIGALLNYGSFRHTLPSTERMVTISDSGTAYATGQESAGSSWGHPGWQSSAIGQGSLGLPTGGPNGASWGEPVSDVTYQEAFLAEAWGTSWAAYYPSSLSTRPASSPVPFYSMQAVLWNNIGGTSTDKFYIIDGSNDFLEPWFFSMYADATINICLPGCGAGQVCLGNNTCTSATVSNAQAEILYLFGSTTFCQVSSTTSNSLSGVLSWNEHHGFLTNDTSTWGSAADSCGHTSTTGSGVAAFFSSIASYL